MWMNGKRALVVAAGATMAVVLAVPAAGAEPVRSERTVEPGSVEEFSGTGCVPDPTARATEVIALVITNGTREGQNGAPYGSHRQPAAADGSWHVSLPMIDLAEADHYLVHIWCNRPGRAEGPTPETLATVVVRLNRPTPPTTPEPPGPAVTEPPSAEPGAPQAPGAPRPKATTPPAEAAKAVRATPTYTG